MLHSREFLAGLASMGIAQFLWTVARMVLLLGPSEWVLGSMPGIYLAGTVVTVATTVFTSIRTDDVTSRAAFFRILAGTYAGMFVSLVVIAPTSRWMVAILYGLGLLLPPLAVGAVAGEVLRKLRGRGRRRSA